MEMHWRGESVCHHAIALLPAPMQVKFSRLWQRFVAGIAETVPVANGNYLVSWTRCSRRQHLGSHPDRLRVSAATLPVSERSRLIVATGAIVAPFS